NVHDNPPPDGVANTPPPLWMPPYRTNRSPAATVTDLVIGSELFQADSYSATSVGAAIAPPQSVNIQRHAGDGVLTRSISGGIARQRQVAVKGARRRRRPEADRDNRTRSRQTRELHVRRFDVTVRSRAPARSHPATNLIRPSSIRRSR